MKLLVFFSIAVIMVCASGSGMESKKAYSGQTPENVAGAVLHYSAGPDKCKTYAHKAEGKIASLSIAEKLDEAANEFLCHRIDAEDQYDHLLTKSLRNDGVKALPELTRRFDHYIPRVRGAEEQDFSSFYIAVMIADDLDNHVIRLRGTEEGRRAIDSLKAAIDRMKKAGADNKHLDAVVLFLDPIQSVNVIDQYVANTLRASHNITLAEKEQLDFSNFLVALDPSYPSWSEIDEDGVMTLKESKRFHEAYLKFTKAF